MPDLDKLRDTPTGHLTTVKWRFPSIHPEGRKFTLIAGFLALVGFTVMPDVFGWLLVGVTIWVAAFFRDPVRTTPTDPKLIVAPADGLVTLISRVSAPLELAGEGGLSGEYTRVSIFMSVFDVHINRSPVAGTVRRIGYVPGKFLNADLDKASEDNERQHFLVQRDDGVTIGFTQIAGLVARRIMSFVKEGDRVEAGERIGLIRFGSRVDVYLPAGTGSQVLLGQRTIAGETILGELGVDPHRSGSSQ
jgi:phosphatidylserine decarboxylase